VNERDYEIAESCCNEHDAVFGRAVLVLSPRYGLRRCGGWRVIQVDNSLSLGYDNIVAPFMTASHDV